MLGARPHVDAAHRGDDRRAPRAGDDRDRHAQHATSAAGVAVLRVLPRRGERARPHRRGRDRPRRSSPPPTTPAPSTTSAAVRMSGLRHRSGAGSLARFVHRRDRRRWPSCRCGAAARRIADVSINGAGSTWSADRRSRSGAADVATPGALGQLPGRRIHVGPRVLLPGPDRLRGLGDPVHSPRTATRRAASSPTRSKLAAHRPYAYLPDRRGRDVVHVPPRHQRSAVHESPPLARLSGEDLHAASMTNWNDPVIRADNPGVNLPSLPIRPIVRSDGSGTTAQFTAYMANQTPDDLERVLPQGRHQHQSVPVGLAVARHQRAPSQQFSDGVADFVAAPYNNGAITYVEYGYALQRNFPVASMLNKAGYYTQPTAANVADRVAGQPDQRRRHPGPPRASTRSPTSARTRSRATAT